MNTTNLFASLGLSAVILSNAALAQDTGNLVRPTPQQLAWQRDELTMFLHFGVNTFTDREWGDGKEDPKIFNPTELNARQWARVAKEAGFKLMILTAKHHDGFCLWPSKYTGHCVKNSPWRGGKGDVVREFVTACRAAGLKVGLYLSPWDRHEPSYGDSPRYNEFYKNQLTELLTHYGPISEVWFDGACGEGPSGRKQQYDWPAFWGTVRRLQPCALMFSDAGPDVRWVGNERGYAGDPCWATVDAAAVTAPGQGGKAIISMLQHGDPNGTVWRAAECDVSIRPGWFYHEKQDTQVKSLAHLLDIYFKSVGRNGVMLLNVPPNKRGLLSAPDVQRLGEFRKTLNQIFAVNLAAGKTVVGAGASAKLRPSNITDRSWDSYWSPADGALPAAAEVDLGKPVTFNVAMIQEYIAQGQRVEEYRLEAFADGAWKQIAAGTTVGHKKLDRFPDVTGSKVRLTILKSRRTPQISHFGLFRAPAVAFQGMK